MCAVPVDVSGAPGMIPTNSRPLPTLYECLLQIAKLIAPLMPFFSEKMYRELAQNGTDSVHLESYPVADENLIEADLEVKMNAAITIVSLARTARTKSRLKIRQPLAEMTVVLPKDVKQAAIEELVDVISEEINIKNVSFSDNDAGLVTLTAKPNFKLLGPKLGKKIKSAKAAIMELPDKTLREFMKSGSLDLKIDGETFTLNSEELEIESIDKENYAVEADNGFTVAISTMLTDDLVLEGYARELVNKIQNMRKTADFQVTDRIKVGIESTDDIKKALDSFGDYIKTETLADDIAFNNSEGEVKQEWDLNGQPATIYVSRV